MWGILQVKFFFVFFGKSREHAVENMVVSFIWILVNNPGLLQQVQVHLGTFDRSIFVEIYINVFSKSRGVVVPNSLCISKSWKMKMDGENLTRSTIMVTFKNRIRFQDLLFNPWVFATNSREILQDQFGALRLACSRLSTDHDALVLPIVSLMISNKSVW